MFFDTLMFDHNAQMKLEVFHSLATYVDGEYQLTYFANLHSLTYHQINKIVSEIDQDISEEQATHGKTWDNLLKKNGKVVIEQHRLKIDKYRYILLKKSMCFQFLEVILSGKKPSVEDFCKELGVGRSTLYRKLMNLSEFLKEYSIRINYQPMDLIGDEATIRTILSYLYWMGTRGIGTPSFARKEEADEIMERNVQMGKTPYNYIAKKQTLLNVYIALARVTTGHYCGEKREWDEIFSYYRPFESVVISSFHFPTDASYRNELNYWYYHLCVAQSYTGEMDLVMEEMLQVFTVQYARHAVTQLCMLFLRFMNKNLAVRPMSEAQRKVLMVNMLSMVFTYYSFAQPIPDFEMMSASIKVETALKEELFVKVKEFFEEILTKKEYARLLSSKDSLIRRFGNLIFPLLARHGKREEIFLGIALENNPIIQNSLKIFLDRLSFVRMEPFDEKNIGEYDMVIHSSSALIEDYPEITNYYMWDLGYGEEEMKHLYQNLHEMYFSKTNN